MSQLLSSDILAAVGIDPGKVKDTLLLRQKASHRVYRLVCQDARYILKYFAQPNGAELKTYALLETLCVPTLPVYARTTHALLLEDLESSPRWRLATDFDMEQAEIGQAVAGWYLQLHRAGRKLFSENALPPEFLHPWIDVITAESLAMAVTRLDLADAPGWETILEHVAMLKSRYHAFPQTLNYSDFAAENLALSCDGPLQAVVFDYDCFSTGTVYSDWRNVTYALQGAARQAFVDAYGSVNPREKMLDEPLSVLEGLVVAAQRERIPAWALPLLETGKSGQLVEDILHRSTS
ncbi:MAG: phosphotransferase [Chloroflexota bacterium]